MTSGALRGSRRRRAWLVLPLIGLALAGGATPEPGSQALPEIACARASGPILADGVADEAAWNEAPWTDAFVDIRGDPALAPPLSTRAKVLWDDAHLYVFADMEEHHLWATQTERDDTIWHENDFEVFLDPDGDGRAYYEIEVNALGTVLDLFLDEPYWRGGQGDLSWDLPGLQVGVDTRGTLNDPADLDGGWSVEMAIPWADLTAPGASTLGVPPAEGDVWRVNFSRVNWPLDVLDGAYLRAPAGADEAHPEDNWVWSPQGVIDMHRPERWGRLRFVEASGGGS